MLGLFYKLFARKVFMLTWKSACLVLTSLFSWDSLFLPRVYMLMNLKLKQLKLDPNPLICNKCVAFLASRVSIVALWKILALLSLLCTPWVRRMLVLLGDLCNQPLLMSSNLCLPILRFLLYPTLKNFWGSLRCKWYRNWWSFDARKMSHCIF